MSVREIAKVAGVSPATVSRVLNGRGRVDPACERRVREAMDRIGYHPVSKAVDARRILLLTPDHAQALQSPYTATLVDGVLAAAAAADLPLSLRPASSRLADAGALRHLLRREGAAGVVLVLMHQGYPLCPVLAREGVPLVTAGRPPAGSDLCAAMPADAAGTAQAAQLLLDLGHRRFGVIAGASADLTQALRTTTFTAAVAAAGATCAVVAGRGYDAATGAAIATALLAAEPRPTALFITNDTLALGALAACRTRGLAVPGDCSLVACASGPWCAFADPPLTRLEVPAEAIGRQSVELLHSWMDGGGRPDTVELAMPLILGGTCGAAPR